VYGFHIDMSLPIVSGMGFMYAKTFMEYYQVRDSTLEWPIHQLAAVTRARQKPPAFAVFQKLCA